MEPNTKKKFDFLVSAAYFSVMLFIAFVVLKYGISYALPFVISFTLISLLNPIINKISRKIPIKKSVLSVFFVMLVYAILGFVIFIAIFALVVWMRDGFIPMLETYVYDAIEGLRKAWNVLLAYIDDLPDAWKTQATSLQSSVMGQLYDLAKNFINVITGFGVEVAKKIPSFFITFLFTIMLSFFISTSYDKVVGFIRLQCSDKTLYLMDQIREIIGSTVVRYIRAMLMFLTITFIELSIGFSFLQLENPIMIAFLVALLDALPVFGTGAVLIPWFLVELILGNHQRALILVIIYITVTAVRNILEPRIVGSSLGISPIVTIVSMYFGFKTIGVAGMIIMPMISRVLIEMNRRGHIHWFKMVRDPVHATGTQSEAIVEKPISSAKDKKSKSSNKNHK